MISLNNFNWSIYIGKDITNDEIYKNLFCNEVNIENINYIKNILLNGFLPSTVLTIFIHNNIFIHPYRGLYHQAISDISDIGRDQYCIYYTTILNLDFNNYYQLKFEGINYKMKIFLNNKILNNNQFYKSGMFFNHQINITPYLNESMTQYRLTIYIEPPDIIGKPIKGNQGGDHRIAENSSISQYLTGWDWTIPIPDRATGIYLPLYLIKSKEISLKEPFININFPKMNNFNYNNILNNNIENNNENLLDLVELIPSINILNLNNIECNISLEFIITLKNNNFEEKIFIDNYILSNKNEENFIFPKLIINNPKLWWPNLCGKQILYNIKFNIYINKNNNLILSDSLSFKIGFRHIKSILIDKNEEKCGNGRLFIINTKPLFIRGGNWIASDGMLNLTEERYKTDILFHKEMGFNMIRIWGGSIIESNIFYNECDKYGILVWQDFSFTGDNNGRGGGDLQYPNDHSLFLDNAISSIKKLRNHPSLCLYCGGNETRPPIDIDKNLRNILSELHPNILYVSGSAYEGFVDGKGGINYLNIGDGPYTIQDPKSFYELNFFQYPFNSEVGSISFPLYSSIIKFLTLYELNIPEYELKFSNYLFNNNNNNNNNNIDNDSFLIYDEINISNILNEHKYMPYGNPEYGIQNQLCLYGIPNNMKSFCEQAQLANYQQYQALFEGYNSKMFNKHTGVLLWKTQYGSTMLRGFLYDWFLIQNSGYYAIKNVLENIHIQWNQAYMNIEIINMTYNNYNENEFNISGKLIDLYGNIIWELNNINYYIKKNSCTKLPYKIIINQNNLYNNNIGFLFLYIKDNNNNNNNNIISKNIYWLNLNRYILNNNDEYYIKYQNRNEFIQLKEMKLNNNLLINLDINYNIEYNINNNEFIINLIIQNIGNNNNNNNIVGFFIEISLYSKLYNNNQLSTINYSNNFITLEYNEINNININGNINIINKIQNDTNIMNPKNEFYKIDNNNNINYNEFINSLYIQIKGWNTNLYNIPIDYNI